jgi:ATP-dependent protease ClpP protease subunit
MPKTWFQIQASADAGSPAEIFLFDEIGGWGIGANEFRAALNSVRESKSILLKVNSPGGDVMTAYAIHNMIRELKVPVTARVVGIAASAASYIALAADEIESFDNALFHIHEAWGVAIGTADEMRTTADFLEQNSEMMLSKYAERAGMTLDELKAKLKAEGGDWWMNGNAASEAGFVDRVIDGEVAIAALAAFDTRRFSVMPKELKSLTEEQEAPAVETEAAPAEETPAPTATEETPATEEMKPAEFVEQAVASLKKARATRAQVEALEAQVSSLNAKISELEAANSQLVATAQVMNELRAEIKKHEEEERTVSARAAEIAASHGLKPDEQRDLPAPHEDAPLSDQYAAISDPAERSAFYNKHKAVLSKPSALFKTK